MLIQTYILAKQKTRNPACPSLRGYKQYQDENRRSVKTSSKLLKEVPTNIVNEIENRLLKSGKDITCTAITLNRYCSTT